MIAAVAFSRDRPMQLDLLLRSMSTGGVTAFDPVTVIYRATNWASAAGYETCASEHPSADFIKEHGSLAATARDVLCDADLACFLTDDDVFYRQPMIPSALAHLCHSFRLGLNTTWCYPLARKQAVPEMVRGAWDWRNADGDFSYPGSLDGHVFRASHLRRALLTCPEDARPNEIEEHLGRWIRARVADTFPLMSCEAESSLVGIPANRVNDTHPNRFGEQHPFDWADLLDRYITGERIDLAALDFSDVRGAHQEIGLVLR